MKIKILFVAFFLFCASGSLFAQFTLCFNTNAITCPYNPNDPANANGRICVTENSTNCGGGCDNGVQLCADLVSGSTQTCITFPHCNFNTCMSFVIVVIPGMTGGCNDANGDNTTGYSLQYLNGNWVLSPYGEHAGGPVSLTFDPGSLTFTCGGSGL